MKKELHLDDKDIAQIIANYFDTDSKDVSIFVQKEVSGYGQMEHEVSVVKAIVQQEEDLYKIER